MLRVLFQTGFLCRGGSAASGAQNVSGKYAGERSPHKRRGFPFPFTSFRRHRGDSRRCEPLKGKRLGQRRRWEAASRERVPFWPIFPTSERARGLVASVPRGLRPRPPARPSREPTCTSPPRRHPGAVAMAPRRPAPRPPSSSPLAPPPAPRSCGAGGGAEVGGDAGGRKSAARRPRLIGCLVVGPEAPPPWRGSRDPFQRWPPCCFDE